MNQMIQTRLPFDDARKPAQTTEDELRVVALIRQHAGMDNPISIARIRTITGLSERQIKGIVERLVVERKMRIGARREDPCGYYLICSTEDLVAAVGPYKAQILAMWRRLRVLEARHELMELLGQLRMEIE